MILELLQAYYANQSEDLEEQIVNESKKSNAFEEFNFAIEEMDNDVFYTMISNLDSQSEKYTTMYDLFAEFNSKNKSKVIIPTKALKNITIKK